MSKLQQIFNFIFTRSNDTNIKQFSMSNYNIFKSYAGCGDVILDVFPKDADKSDPTQMAACIHYDPKKNKGICFSTFDEHKNSVFEANLLRYIHKDNNEINIEWDNYVVNELGKHYGFEAMFENEEAIRIQRKKNNKVETSYLV